MFEEHPNPMPERKLRFNYYTRHPHYPEIILKTSAPQHLTTSTFSQSNRSVTEFMPGLSICDSSSQIDDNETIPFPAQTFSNQLQPMQDLQDNEQSFNQPQEDFLEQMLYKMDFSCNQREKSQLKIATLRKFDKVMRFKGFNRTKSQKSSYSFFEDLADINVLDEESDEDLNSDCGRSRIDEQVMDKMILMGEDQESRLQELDFYDFKFKKVEDEYTDAPVYTASDSPQQSQMLPPDVPYETAEDIKPLNKDTSTAKTVGYGVDPPKATQAKHDLRPSNRLTKVICYWRKKHKPKLDRSTKLIHKRKSKVANKRLRVRGKFVTVVQAIKLIGKRQTNKLLK